MLVKEIKKLGENWWYAVLYVILMVIAFAMIFVMPQSSSGAILLSALIAGIVAYFTISKNRDIAKKSMTIKLIHDTSWDKDFIEARNTFSDLKSNSEGLLKLLEPKLDDDGVNKRRHLYKILNHYELISIGIKEDILCEATYQWYFRSRFVADYDATSAFIHTKRKVERGKAKKDQNPDRLWIEFENLATKWKGE